MSEPAPTTPPAPQAPVATEPFDPAKIPDTDFEKIFTDPRVFTHSRFKELNDQAKEGKKLKEEAAKREEEALKESGKYKELAEKRDADYQQAKKDVETMRMDNQLLISLQKEGVVDADAALKLIDRSKLSVDESGQVKGVDDAVKGLKDGKGYLFTKPSATVAGGSNPSPSGQPGTTKTFLQSQIADSAFYKANREDILAAQRAGTITMDITPGFGNRV